MGLVVNVQNPNNLFSDDWWNHCDQKHALLSQFQKTCSKECWEIIESYLANQFWLSAGWGWAFARGRRRRERRDVASILLVVVLVAVLVADVGARGAILVPCSGPRICTCTALLRHQPPVYMGRCSLLGGLGWCTQSVPFKSPTTHMPCSSKVEQHVFYSFVQTFTSDLAQKLVSLNEGGSRIQNPYPTLAFDVGSVQCTCSTI